MKMNRQHGSMVIILVLLLLVLGGLGVFLYTTKGRSTEVRDTPMVVDTQKQIEETKPTFEVLPETSRTPEAINNQVLNEMDQLVESVVENDNLDDLDTY